MDAPEIERKVKSAIADGLNQLADIALVDIEQHVHIKTGRLHDSYAVTQRATPESLQVVVASPVDYRVYQYPYDPERANGAGALMTDDGKKLEAIAQQVIEDAINRAFQ